MSWSVQSSKIGHVNSSVLTTCYNETDLDKVRALGFDAEKEESWVTGSPESVYLGVFLKDHLQLHVNTDTLVPIMGKVPTMCCLEMWNHHRAWSQAGL